MPGWGKLITGAVLGAAGVLYATNEELRKQLPEAARELPVAVRRRFQAAAAAAREASARRRVEILEELEAHGRNHAGRRAPGTLPEPPPELRAAPPTPRANGKPVTPAEE